MKRKQYHFVTRSGANGPRRRILVFDCDDRLHTHLSLFAEKAVQQIALSSLKVYLYELCNFFTFLATDVWQLRAGVSWDSGPEKIRAAVIDYLAQSLGCKVRGHRLGFELVSRTAETRGTVIHFLSGLKMFYRIMVRAGYYPFDNPLVDAAAVMAEDVEERLRGRQAFPRMPACSGVEDPRLMEAKRKRKHLSDSFFKIEGEEWIPQAIDDAEFPARILEGGRRVGWRLRETNVTYLLFESGGRVSEITGLTVGDWEARGLRREATAFSKGSNGRRVKTISFSDESAKRLRRYFDTERRELDPHGRTLSEYLTLAGRGQLDLYDVPIFLTTRRTTLTPKHYRDNYWKPACKAISYEADVHQARHWYVTQAVRHIYETSRDPAEIKRRLRGLINYMHWKRGWETLDCYEHFFDPERQREVQDAVHQRMDEAVRRYERDRRAAAAGGREEPPPAAAGGALPAHVAAELAGDPDFDFLMRIGG